LEKVGGMEEESEVSLVIEDVINEGNGQLQYEI
jgi:hypothetical protein